MNKIINQLRGDKTIWAVIVLLALVSFLPVYSASTNLVYTVGNGKGSTLIDSNGKKYLDGIAGLWCVNIGYGNEEMANAISEQATKLAYYQTLTSYGTDIAAEYSARLIDISPVPMSKVFFGSSGSDANDTMVKIVWSYHNYLGKPDKKKIISRKHGYHVSTIFAGGLTGFSNLHKN